MVCLVASACKKNKPCEVEYINSYNLDTIYPSEYLAAYPGSWWEYDNGNRDECTAWKNESKQLSVVHSDGCNTIFRDYLIVPKVNNYYVYGDFTFTRNNSTNTTVLRQKVGAVGDSWKYTENFDEGHKTYRWSVDSLLDFKEVNGVIYEDVIFAFYSSSIYYDHNFGGPPPDETYFYYARNVGLIKYEHYANNGYGNPPDVEYGLENYYIAPH